MLNDKDIVEISNKINGVVAYAIPERNNLVRHFNPYEHKKVEMEELRALSYNKGGRRLMQSYLTIHNKEALAELLGEVEPEYFYTAEDIHKLLESGTIDQFEDFLNFAPEGTVEQMKDIAISTKLNDNRKREMIKAKLGFDISNAIKLLEDDVEKVAEPAKKTRKAAPIKEAPIKEEPAETGRKAAPITSNTFSEKKYNVVN